MIKFFRKIRQNLITENKFSKYLIYAIGEIFLVVIGILIAVGINEWRSEIKKEKEIKGYYQGLRDDINQDKLRLSFLDSLFKNAEKGIIKEIDNIQFSNYNTDSLYSNVSSWMVYIEAFAPNNSTFTEIVSSGKLQLLKNKELKSQILNLYGNLYSDLLVRETANNEAIRSMRTIELMDTFRWMSILDNDGKIISDVNLNNPKIKIDHKWLEDKQSDKYLKFENYLNMTRAAYLEVLNRYKVLDEILQKLIVEIDNEMMIL